MEEERASDKLKTIKATEAKQKFGQLMDMAIKEPIIIEKHKRPYAVMMSIEHYNYLKCPGEFVPIQTGSIPIGHTDGEFVPIPTNQLMEQLKALRK